MRDVYMKTTSVLIIGCALLTLLIGGEALAQSTGATDFNINSFSIAQRRAGNASDINNLARNNPGYDPCLSPTGLNSGAKCDGPANALLSVVNVGGATNDDTNRQGGFFHATSFGAVTDNMFGAISATGPDPTVCGVIIDTGGVLTGDTGVTTGLNCGNLRYNPDRQQMKLPQGSNSFHSENFPLRRFFSFEMVSEDKTGVDPFGTPSGSPIPSTADRTSFCGDTSVDTLAVTPCQLLPLAFPGIGTGFSSDFTFRRPTTAPVFSCGKNFRTGAAVNTLNPTDPVLTCAVNGVTTETQMEGGFPDQHVELGSYFHVKNPDCVRLIAGDTSCDSLQPGLGNTSALVNSHDPGSNPVPITITWAQYINDPDLAGGIDLTLSQPAAFAQTMVGSFNICNPNVWTGCNQTFPKVNAPTGESQSRGDPNFFVGVDPN